MHNEEMIRKQDFTLKMFLLEHNQCQVKLQVETKIACQQHFPEQNANTQVTCTEKPSQSLVGEETHHSP